MGDFEIVEYSKNINGFFEKRYKVVLADTGKILDDSQGYGYMSKESARKAYEYKLMLKKSEIENRIKKWLKWHKDFVVAIDMVQYQISKGCWSTHNKFDLELVQKMLKRWGLEIDFPIKDLIRVWRKLYH